MEKVKKFQYELTALAALSVLYIVNFTTITTMLDNSIAVALQLIAAALFTGRFINSFENRNKKIAAFFGGSFIVFFLSSYHYSLLSAATVDNAHTFGFVLFICSLYCLCSEKLSLLTLPVSAVGLILCKDYAFAALPILAVISAFAGNGIFAATQSKISEKKDKAKKKVDFAKYNRFIAPCLLAMAVITAISYFTGDFNGHPMLITDYGYYQSQTENLLTAVPALITVFIVWLRTFKNKKLLACFICMLFACVITVIGGLTLDFTICRFRFFLLYVITGMIATTLIIAAREKDSENGLKKAILSFDKKQITVIVIVMMLQLIFTFSKITD